MLALIIVRHPSGHIVRHVRMGETVKQLLGAFPSVSLSASIQPITRSVLRVRLSITPDYIWDDRIHGSSDPWWIWVEDPENNYIYHSECYVLQKKMVCFVFCFGVGGGGWSMFDGFFTLCMGGWGGGRMV